MPAILRLDELPIKWIAKAQYKAAQAIASNADERIYTDADASSAYVLTSAGLQTLHQGSSRGEYHMIS